MSTCWSEDAESCSHFDPLQVKVLSHGQKRRGGVSAVTWAVDEHVTNEGGGNV